MNWRTANKRQRRKRQIVPHYKMGRCAGIWRWTYIKELGFQEEPFRGYRYYSH